MDPNIQIPTHYKAIVHISRLYLKMYVQSTSAGAS